MNKPIETYLVDSFTDTPFKGNPAGVCILERHISDANMLAIAQELGLSETAFVQQTKNKNSFDIRYFSPKMEIPLCGHATLATAKVLFEKYKKKEVIHFSTIQSIDLKMAKKGDTIEMEFPVYQTSPINTPEKLIQALGLRKIVACAYNKETKIILLEIEKNQELRGLNPDFEALKNAHDSINGVLVTAISDQEGYDFESRYFWPWSGTNEDPVTGATHTFLTPYWSQKLGKTKMKSFQCSQRTGFMELELKENDTLRITSTAKIIFQGTLNV